MRAIEPTKEQLEKFISLDQEQPIVMLNLLKFKDQATYPEGSEHAACTGLEAYMLYSAVAMPSIEKVGGKILWSSVPEMKMITGSDENWDMTAIVRYPSRKAFLEMTTALPEYQAALVHREAGLAYQELIQCAEGFSGL